MALIVILTAQQASKKISPLVHGIAIGLILFPYIEFRTTYRKYN